MFSSQCNLLSSPASYLHILHWDLDNIMINPSQSHLDLLLEVGPARPVGQRSVKQRLDPGEAVAEDRVQGHAHPVDKLNLPQIFLSEPSSGHENSTKYLKWIQIYLFEVERQQTSAANRLIGEVVQSRRRPLLGPSPG